MNFFEGTDFISYRHPSFNRILYFSLVQSSISNDESSKLINEIFRVICDLTNDEAKIVRIQAMKMIVNINNL